MDFREYLFYNNILIKDIAPQLNIHRSYLSLMICGKIPYSKKVAKEIEKVTEGLVKAIDIVGTFQKVDYRKGVIDE